MFQEKKHILPGPPPAVDHLVRVANCKQFRRLLRAAQRFKELKLESVAVLHFVYDHPGDSADEVKNLTLPGKKAVLNVQETKSIFRGDREVILEVAENLFSNAFRYARKQIRVQVSLTASVLKISVSDDGTGFQEDAEKITRAFHQKNVKDSLTHTGMGMYISRLYCEKHGGKLLLENNEAGGA